MRKLVKNLLKSCAVGRAVYEPLHQLYRLWSVPHRRKMLQKHGKEVLQHVFSIGRKYDIPIFAAAGTLLGLVREHGFMKHDDDIDLGVLPGKWTPKDLLRILVEKEDFKFEFAFQFRGKLAEFKVSWRGVPIDFFFYARDESGFYCTVFYYFPCMVYPQPNANSVWRIYEYDIREIKSISVLGLHVPIPSEPEKVMAKLYGEDWRTPNPKWDDSMHPGRKVMDGEFGYSIGFQEAMAL